MQKKIFFCDYCGKEVKEEEQVSMLYITAPKKLIGKFKVELEKALKKTVEENSPWADDPKQLLLA